MYASSFLWFLGFYEKGVRRRDAFGRCSTAQFGGASGEVFSAICGMKIPRFTSSKPSKFAFASDEKSIRRPTISFVRRLLRTFATRS